VIERVDPVLAPESADGEIWRRLPDSTEPMDWQLARTEALLTGLGAGAPPSLRWYAPDAPALVLGRSQKPEVLDHAALRAAGVRAYGRTSGGGVVLIDQGALSLDVALPAGHPLLSRDVTLSYRWVGEVWVEALATLGISARALPTEEARAAPQPAPDDPLRQVCYGTLSPWEVVVGARKVVGLSQVRRKAGALLPMSVYLRWEPQRLAGLLALPEHARDRLTTDLRARAAGLDELAGRVMVAHEVSAAFEQALRARLRIRLAPGAWLEAEEAAARCLIAGEFRALEG
jgi:lipoate---protein ligase